MQAFRQNWTVIVAGKAAPIAVKLTANFERNLEQIEPFLIDGEAAPADVVLLDALFNTLLETVIPNLERFPTMGRSFMARPVHCVETCNAIDVLQGKLARIDSHAEIREYALPHHLLLYAFAGKEIFLLAIAHHKQLSFDFEGLW
jgi:hypothetical protein